MYKNSFYGEMVGGAIVVIDADTQNNHLDFLFVKYGMQSKGLGKAIRGEIEKKHTQTKVWETCTPYFDKRNIHFYVNKCGFKIDEFWCEHFAPTQKMPDDEEYDHDEGPNEMFHFVKVMK